MSLERKTMSNRNLILCATLALFMVGCFPSSTPSTTPTPTWDGEAVKGSSDAKVTIIEYSDYQCPFCARFALETEPQVEQQYVSSGQVKLIFRALPFHALSMETAQAAQCAGEQGKYWEMHDALFEHQSEWSGNPGATELFKSYAEDLGLNTSNFNTCLNTEKYASRVQEDLQKAINDSIEATPSFLINSHLVVGAYPFSDFKTIIDQALAE
jgi:protein-disulfide isomerase